MPAQNIFFDHLTIKEGLPHNTVYSVVQDKQGFMWLGTENGLVRYDGYSFRHFQVEEDGQQRKASIRSIYTLYLDSKTKIWIGTESDGLICYDIYSGNWRQIALISQKEPVINAVFEDNQGNFWIGTMNDGCFVLDANYKMMHHFDVSNSVFQGNSIFAFAQDRQGNIWIAGAGTGLYCYDFKEMKEVHTGISKEEDIGSFRKCLYFDELQNSLWIGTEIDGLYIYNIDNHYFKHYKKNKLNNLPCNGISDIKKMPNGKFWLTSDGDGLLECDPTIMDFRQETYHKNFSNGLNTNHLFKIFIDKDENVWLTSFNGGVNIFKKYRTYFPNLKEWTKQNVELSNRSVLSICETKNGQIWFGTDGGGINMWDKNKGTFHTFVANSAGFPSGNVPKCLFEDSHGKLWAGYFDKGLNCYDIRTQQTQHFLADKNNANALCNNNVWCITEDGMGNLWFGTLNGGMSRYDPQTGIFTNYRHEPNNPNSLSENNIFTIFVDKNNNIWIGTQNQGLNYFDPKTGIFTHFFKENKRDNSLSANDIRCIYQDEKGRLWVGTESAGLNLWLGDGKFKHYSVENGLLSEAIMGILEDDRGMLWLSSFQGISRFDTEKEVFSNYDFHISDLNNQFNQLAIAKLSDGNLCFGGINGVNFINPNQLMDNKLEPEVHFADFKIFNRSVLPNDETKILTKDIDETSEIHLFYKQNLFTIEFSALEYTNPYDISYAYRLEGFDDAWRYTNGRERNVSYNNLSHGTYRFRVRATNSNGVWSSRERELLIVIYPPFWKTVWFRLLMLFMLALMLFWGFKTYTRRREEQLRATMLQQEKEILRLQKENLEKEVAGKTTELMSKALQMGHKNEVMQKIKESLKDLRSEQNDTGIKKLQMLENLVKYEMQDEDNWNQFRMYFDQVNQNYTATLVKRFPNLTQNDIRMCILIKLNLSVKEMASLLNISTQGVEKSKYRLKKRLNLNVEDDLMEFLRAI